MFTTIYEMARRRKQKVLFEKIFEFLESKYGMGINKEVHKEWLLEFTCHTSAKEPSEITFKDVESYTKHVFEKENALYRRVDAARALRKFFAYCVLKRYMRRAPTEQSEIPPSKEEITVFMNKVLSRNARLPNVELARKIRIWHDQKGLSFNEIAQRLEKETGKKYYKGNLCNLYHNIRAQ